MRGASLSVTFGIKFFCLFALIISQFSFLVRNVDLNFIGDLAQSSSTVAKEIHSNLSLGLNNILLIVDNNTHVCALTYL